MEKPIFFCETHEPNSSQNSSLNSSACFARIPDMTKELKFLPWSARFRKQLTRKRLEKPNPIKNFEFGASVQSFCFAGQNSRATGPKWKTWLPWNSQSVPCLGASNTRDVIRQHELVQESWRARFHRTERVFQSGTEERSRPAATCVFSAASIKLVAVTTQLLRWDGLKTMHALTWPTKNDCS